MIGRNYASTRGAISMIRIGRQRSRDVSPAGVCRYSPPESLVPTLLPASVHGPAQG
jgi:hypothetical protein